MLRDETIQRVIRFRDDRDWRQFHTPKDLAISLTLEAAELLAAEGISYRFPALEVSVVRDIAGGVMPGAKIDREYVVQFVMANFKKLTR